MLFSASNSRALLTTFSSPIVIQRGTGCDRRAQGILNRKTMDFAADSYGNEAFDYRSREAELVVTKETAKLIRKNDIIKADSSLWRVCAASYDHELGNFVTFPLKAYTNA